MTNNEPYAESQIQKLFENNITNHTWWTSYPQQDTLSTYDLPFIPGGEHNLDYLTLALNATHPGSNMTEYNLHNLFGHMQGKMTKEVMQNLNISRPLVMSRSTFAGSG